MSPGTGGTMNTGGTSTSGGTTSAGGSTSTGGASTSGGTGGSLGLGGSLAFGGAGEGGAGEGGVTNGAAGAGAGNETSGAGGEGGSGGAVKQPLSGLIDMQIISWHNSDAGVPTFNVDELEPFAGLFGGIVINVAWNQLQPSQSDPIDFSFIDGALADVRVFNDNHPTAALGVKLRVYAGSTTPDWAKAINDGPVPIYRNHAGCAPPATLCPITVGKFWTPEFIAAWRALQTALAARYDDEPLIRQVAVTSCAAQTDEPFVATEDQGPDGEEHAHQILKDYGYTDALEQSCLSGAVDDYAAWKRTLIDYTFNPFNSIDGGLDSGFTTSVMEACREKLGARCVLDNHALQWPEDSNLSAVYDEMSETLHAPINFQTQAPIPDKCQWTATIADGVWRGARAIEIWPATKAGFIHLTSDQVGQLAAEFTTPIPVPAGTPTTDCNTSTGDIFF